MNALTVIPLVMASAITLGFLLAVLSEAIDAWLEARCKDEN